MSQRFYTFQQPSSPSLPPLIRQMLFVFLATTGLTVLTNNLIVFFFEIPGPKDWLSLSWWGMKHGFLWQPITYLFTYRLEEGGLSLSYLFDFGFNLFLLAFFGSDLVTRMGKRSFLTFYFLSGILSGLLSLLLMPLTGQYGTLSGPIAPIISMMVLWTLINPSSLVLLFFLIPIQAKWLNFGLISAMLLLSLSNADLIHFFLYAFAVLIGQFYGLFVLGLHSPFPSLYKFELALLRMVNQASTNIKKIFPFFKSKPSTKTVIIDLSVEDAFKTDDEFIDAMLEKISKFGKQSLSKRESERMRKISENRGKEKSDGV